MKKIIIIFVVVLALALSGYYIATRNPDGQSVNDSNSNISGKTVTFDVVAKQFEFVPAVLNVSKGDNVIINLTSADVMHGFTIDEFDIDETIKQGEKKQVKFVADKAGSFVIRCTIPCGQGHRDMKGQLIVAEQVQVPVSDSDKFMDLSGQKLTKLPESLFGMSDLEVLDISDNNLTGALPSQIGQLKNLMKLDASNNQMTGIPAEVGQLSKLQELNYSNNLITGLPNEIANLKNLKIFNLTGNQYSKQDLAGIKQTLPELRVIGE